MPIGQVANRAQAVIRGGATGRKVPDHHPRMPFIHALRAWVNRASPLGPFYPFRLGHDATQPGRGTSSSWGIFGVTRALLVVSNSWEIPFYKVR
jgi:hypothetical protein